MIQHWWLYKTKDFLTFWKQSKDHCIYNYNNKNNNTTASNHPPTNLTRKLFSYMFEFIKSLGMAKKTHLDHPRPQRRVGAPYRDLLWKEVIERRWAAVVTVVSGRSWWVKVEVFEGNPGNQWPVDPGYLLVIGKYTTYRWFHFFHSYLGKVWTFDEHNLSDGWFNHQPVFHFIRIPRDDLLPSLSLTANGSWKIWWRRETIRLPLLGPGPIFRGVCC